MNGVSIGLKQFRAEGCLSYLVSDPGSAVAALIDPNLELIDEYREYLRDHGLKLALVFDTHIHADHFSASHVLRDEFDARIVMAEPTLSARPSQKLKHHERVALGALSFQALATPGHTPDSMSLVVNSAAVFTGDSLFIGSTGRTDFPQADPRALWHSLHEVLATLPPGTVMYPGHDYNDLLFSTIGTELKTNAHLASPELASIEAFAELKRQELVGRPTSQISERVEFNLSANPAARSGSVGACTPCGAPTQGGSGNRFASIGVEKYRHKLSERAAGFLYVDVREEDEFREGHMPGALNIPLSEVGLRLPELRAAGRVYVSCLSGRRSEMAVRTLSHVGLADVVNVTGGFKAWAQAGLPIEA